MPGTKKFAGTTLGNYVTENPDAAAYGVSLWFQVPVKLLFLSFLRLMCVSATKLMDFLLSSKKVLSCCEYERERNGLFCARNVRRKPCCRVSGRIVGTQVSVYVFIPIKHPARCVNSEQGKQGSILAFYQTIASRMSWSRRYLGYLRGFHQFLCNFGSDICGIVRLHPGRSTMSCKPFFQDDLCSCLRIILIKRTWDCLCNFGEMVDDD